MIETINIFFGNLMLKENITSLHLAEGPGGFIEAINYVRNIKFPNNSDKYYGITLLNDIQDNNIPSWKKSVNFLKNNNNKIKIITGYDNTGNLTNPDNIKYLWQRFKYNKCDLITGDGGLDFSCNIKNQEEIASKLIYSQIISGLCCLNIGGYFMLKIFDMNNILTIDMIYLLYLHFNKLVIYKPKTSRLANSEKYIIGIGFKGCSEEFKLSLIENLKIWNKIDKDNEKLIAYFKDCKINKKNIDKIYYIYKQINNLIFNKNTDSKINKIKNEFYSLINNINNKIITEQIKNINFTLKFCDLLNNKKLFIKSINNRLIKQTINAQQWCIDNNIPFYNKIY
jgi:hypothetical protein